MSTEETTTAEPPGPTNLSEVTPLGVDRYDVVERIGRGGMGEVLAARDTVLGREIAIKRLLTATPSARQVDRFLREARIQGALDHPSIPPVYELARDLENRPYFAMKRLSGHTLTEILAGIARGDAPIVEGFTRERLLRAFAEVCRAVEFAHVRGVIHRDLKPSNIMLGKFGEVFVLDWGVAKVVGAIDGEATVLDALEVVDDRKTQSTHIVGTRGYMAPEQATPTGALDGRADVYALGRVLADILESRHDADQPPELAELVRAATAPSVDARLQSAWELGDRVQRYLDGDRDLAQRRTLAEVHLERAVAAMTAGDGQRVAIREAGRAMALDPSLPGAAELVSRLMLEPPRETPPEVEASLAEARTQVGVRQARVGLMASFAYLLFAPFLLWAGLRSAPYLITFAVLAAGHIALALSIARRPIPSTGFSARKYAVVVSYAVQIALLARMFSPVLIAPGLAAVTAAILTSNPTFRTPRVWPVIVILSLGLVLPWLAELAGWISPTLALLPDHMVIMSVIRDANLTGVTIGLLVFGPVLVMVTALLMLQRVRLEDEIQTRVHLQAWRLRQLVPG